MKYILDTLNIIDKVANELNLGYSKENKYSELVQSIYIIEESGFSISTELRNSIEEYLVSVENEKEKELIAKFNGLVVEETDRKVIDNLSYSDLDDWKLVHLLAVTLRTISYTQKDNLLLVKYSNNIWVTGWNKLAKQSRGKVIDLNTMTYVSYPFNKFYNLNEVEETKEERILDLLSKAREVYVTDKKDGSAIIVTNYNGKIIMNTNGSFDSVQIPMAEKLFENKYSYFYNNIPEGYTFIFELIHPDNRIVLDYGKEKSLYLLAIRELDTLRMKTYPELLSFAKEYKLDITESFEYTDLFDFVEKATNNVEDIKEGWVFRIITDTEDFMFKLKYQEYFKLARIKNIPSLKKVYSLLVSNTIDDVMSVAESSIKDAINRDITEIYDYVEKFKVIISEEVEEIKDKFEIDGVLEKDKIKLVLDYLKENPFMSYILRELKGGMTSATAFDRLPSLNNFGNMYKYTNKKLGIEEDNWESREIL